MLDEFNRDVTSLGGLPVFIIVIIVSFILGHELLARKLVIGLILCYLITIIIRFFHFKPRPKQEVYRNLVEKLDASSFPSLHSMRATILTILLSLEFSNSALIVLFSASALAVYATRIALRRHYFIDVLFGALFGAIIGISLAFTF